MIKIFVYGTLKKGGLNHGLIGRDPDNEFIENAKINDYTLYVSGMIPFAIASSGDYIEGEVFLVSEETFENIERLELGAGYHREVSPDGIIFYSYYRALGKPIGSNYDARQERTKNPYVFYTY